MQTPTTSPEIDFDSINQFHYLDQWWVRISENCINIGWKSLPADIHLTLSFHPDAKDINIHLTRNTTNEGRKPAIELLRINRDFLNSFIQENIPNLLQHILVPARLPGYYMSDPDVWFMPFETLDQDDHPEIERFKSFMQQRVQKASKLKRKGRMKMTTDIETIFQNKTTAHVLYRFIDGTVQDVTKQIHAAGINGVIGDERKNKVYLVLDGSVYKINPDLSQTNLTTAILGVDLEKQFFENLSKAVAILSSSATYEDAQKHSIDPIIVGECQRAANQH